MFTKVFSISRGIIVNIVFYLHTSSVALVHRLYMCHEQFLIFFSGYLYGHVSYLADDCEACLLLLSVDREQFFTLSEAKQKIVDVCCNCC